MTDYPLAIKTREEWDRWRRSGDFDPDGITADATVDYLFSRAESAENRVASLEGEIRAHLRPIAVQHTPDQDEGCGCTMLSVDCLPRAAAIEYRAAIDRAESAEARLAAVNEANPEPKLFKSYDQMARAMLDARRDMREAEQQVCVLQDKLDECEQVSSGRKAQRDRLERELAESEGQLSDLRTPLPCGHPAACVEGKTTKWCGWCVERYGLTAQRDEARSECDRLRAALEWYGENDNYSQERHRYRVSRVQIDRGQRARAALEGK